MQLHLNLPHAALDSTVIVEAGHIYTSEQPGLEHRVGAEYGAQFSAFLQGAGARVQKWLFIDDYNPAIQGKPQSLDEAAYLAALSSQGFAPDSIVKESALVTEAIALLAQLQSSGHTRQTREGKTALSKEGVLLYDASTGRHYCSLLDAALYLRKLRGADACVTVLDAQYRQQQKGTLTILKKLGADTSTIAPVFYSTPTALLHPSVHPSQVFAPGSLMQRIHWISEFFQVMGRAGAVYTLQEAHHAS
ncbi:MAG: hypothetical protein Q7S65_05020 [Nanoarchaeota archaeon]|nr:hypothetical protein [Nanoarchaeota archaeon]